MPSINGGMKIVKYSLFVFNLVFVALGIILIYQGVQVKTGFAERFGYFVGSNDGGHSIPPTIFIAVGVIMFVIAFLGCCGAVTENHCMMMLYSVLVGLILVIQLGAAIAAYAFQDDVEKVMSDDLEKSLELYFNTSSPLNNDTVRSWNILQDSLQCCGVHNYTDWGHLDNNPHRQDKALPIIPQSCCIGGSVDDCTKSITDDTLNDFTNAGKHIYTEGCLPAGIKAFSINHMGTLGIIFAVIEGLGVACACMMARSIRFSYETV